MKRSQVEEKKTQELINFEEGILLFRGHPIFRRFRIQITELKNAWREDTFSKHDIVIVHSRGIIYGNSTILQTKTAWAHQFAHAALHLGFGHFLDCNMPGHFVEDNKGEKKWQVDCNIRIWNIACDIYVENFLLEGKIFSEGSAREIQIPKKIVSEIEIYNYLLENECAEEYTGYGTTLAEKNDMVGLENPLDGKSYRYNYYTRMFMQALVDSMESALRIAGGYELEDKDYRKHPAREAKEWFVSSFPLLGAMADAFELEIDNEVCERLDIQIAAVDSKKGIIYIKPLIGMCDEEYRFILAHEMLHVALGHAERCQGRNAYLYNIACDYVINDWLYELKIGDPSRMDVLYDKKYHGMSAEEIYDELVKDIKKNLKLQTLRGFGKGEFIGNGQRFDDDGIGVDFDTFCKNALYQGYEIHNAQKRGYLPAGLIEEIRAVMMPPIPWEVELAKWFDAQFPLPENRRSYARVSRRQSCTPDIPRPGRIHRDTPEDPRTFGVVIDTSGSMSDEMLAKALGCISSYAIAKEIYYVRVVCCDAAAYDKGYITPDELSGRVEVMGRGGTILQPGIDSLQYAKDFPKDGPILVITDGQIEDRLFIQREHAYLLPSGSKLPFQPKGKLFYMI